MYSTLNYLISQISQQKLVLCVVLLVEKFISRSEWRKWLW